MSHDSDGRKSGRKPRNSITSPDGRKSGSQFGFQLHEKSGSKQRSQPGKRFGNQSGTKFKYQRGKKVRYLQVIEYHFIPITFHFLFHSQSTGL